MFFCFLFLLIIRHPDDATVMPQTNVMVYTFGLSIIKTSRNGQPEPVPQTFGCLLGAYCETVEFTTWIYFRTRFAVTSQWLWINPGLLVPAIKKRWDWEERSLLTWPYLASASFFSQIALATGVLTSSLGVGDRDNSRVVAGGCHRGCRWTCRMGWWKVSQEVSLWVSLKTSKAHPGTLSCYLGSMRV